VTCCSLLHTLVYLSIFLLHLSTCVHLSTLSPVSYTSSLSLNYFLLCILVHSCTFLYILVHLVCTPRLLLLFTLVHFCPLLYILVYSCPLQVNPEEGGGIDWESEVDRLLVMKMLIKMADINTPSKSYELHRSWSKRITEEFYQQVSAHHMVSVGQGFTAITGLLILFSV